MSVGRVFWIVHWIHPLHKRNSQHNPDHYRGLQLTSQLSKAVERFICSIFLPPLYRDLSFGAFQFAYTPGRGARDAILFVTMSWLSAFGAGQRVALYCSDVAGAFDRVSAERLLAKRASSDLHPKILIVLEDWLAPRSAYVVCNGAVSDCISMSNMVYQGTVFGPSLWNEFYADARDPIMCSGFQEVVFADDLNAFKLFANSVPDPVLFSHLGGCQQELHKWGRANGVSFEPAKESFHILSHRSPAGENFKLLGIVFDCKLLMHEAISTCSCEGGWRSLQILSCRRYYSIRELVFLYKSHVLSYLEFRTPAISHASSSSLLLLDGVQQRFLMALEVSELDALLSLSLAPLAVRRDIAILGMIHRTALGLGPGVFRQFFSPDRSPPPPRLRSLRSASASSRRHVRHLVDPLPISAPDYVVRSPLGAVRIYNILPDSIIGQSSVKEFQSCLQYLVAASARNGVASWQTLLSWRQPLAFHPLLPVRDWRPS